MSQLARKLLTLTGLSKLLCMIHTRPRILMLHGVGTPALPVNVFRKQIVFIKRYFHTVPLNQIVGDGESEHDGRPKVALTFDDGLRNNFSVAYPILREFGVPATFFVCPGLIQSRSWLWNHECRCRLETMSAQAMQIFAASIGLEDTNCDTLIQTLKYMPNRERRSAEQRLREATTGF